jgi:hypothetical protein
MAMKLLSIALQALVALAAGIILYGTVRWRSATADLRTRLEATARKPAPATYDELELEGLPPPVQRYFRAVLEPGQPIVAAARFSHEGQFNSSESARKWSPFTSHQLVVTRPPGFDWDARIRLAPGVRAHVHDAYVAGEGFLEAALFGLITVAEAGGTPEMSHGELMRFLAEAVWYPTALLPGQGIRWEAIDDSSARATIRDGSTQVSLAFRFDGDGLISTVYAAERFRAVGDDYVSTPWQGSFRGYEKRSGMRIPLEGEVAWLRPDGPLPYWRARISDMSYDFAR